MANLDQIMLSGRSPLPANAGSAGARGQVDPNIFAQVLAGTQNPLNISEKGNIAGTEISNPLLLDGSDQETPKLADAAQALFANLASEFQTDENSKNADLTDGQQNQTSALQELLNSIDLSSPGAFGEIRNALNQAIEAQASDPASLNQLGQITNKFAQHLEALLSRLEAATGVSPQLKSQIESALTFANKLSQEISTRAEQAGIDLPDGLQAALSKLANLQTSDELQTHLRQLKIDVDGLAQQLRQDGRPQIQLAGAGQMNLPNLANKLAGTDPTTNAGTAQNLGTQNASSLAALASATDGGASTTRSEIPVITIPANPAATGSFGATSTTTPASFLAGTPQSQPINLPVLGFEIARQVQAGNSRFQIRLDPPELGRIDVQLEIDQSGKVNARLAVERAETLELLNRDARALEKALADAGLDKDNTDLEFSLQQDLDGRGAFEDDQEFRLAEDDQAPILSEIAAQAQQIYQGSASPGGLSMWV